MSKNAIKQRSMYQVRSNRHLALALALALALCVMSHLLMYSIFIFMYCSHICGAQVDPAIAEAGDIDTSLCLLTFENGVVATVDNSRKATYGYDQRVEVFGSKVGIGDCKEFA